MTTEELRKLFVEENGRYDLVSDYPTCETDNGVDRYLNRAQYLLDRLVTPHGRKERRFFELSVDQKSIELERVIHIQEVFVVNSDNETVRLQYEPDIYTLIKDVEGTDDAGTPLYWGLNIALTDEDTPSNFDGSEGVIASGTGDHEKKVILISPPSDADVTLQVIGRFKSVPLVTGESAYWLQDQNVAAMLAASRFYLMQSLAAGTGTREALEAVRYEAMQLIADQIELESEDRLEYL